jgi:hypothetical protein
MNWVQIRHDALVRQIAEQYGITRQMAEEKLAVFERLEAEKLAAEKREREKSPEIADYTWSG